MPNEYIPDWVSPPGDTLRDLIAEKGRSPADLGLPESTVMGIIDEGWRITPRIAAKLEEAFGTPASFWLNREAQYREALNRLRFDIVLATDDTGGIGKNGRLPWKLKGELLAFKRLTIGDGNNAVIMGRKTWESLPTKPLPKRVNVVLSAQPGLPDLPPGVLHAYSLDDALAQTASATRRFVIGGFTVYEEAFKDRRCERVHWTQVAGDFECDIAVILDWIISRFENSVPPEKHTDGKLKWTTRILTRKGPVTQKEADEAFIRRQRNEYLEQYSEDVDRIVSVLQKQIDVQITSEQAVFFWEWRSECLAASWLTLGDDADILSAFESFVRDVHRY